MKWFKNVFARWHKESTAPSAPTPSMFSAGRLVADQTRERDLEMALAVEKERQRRGMAF